jgi:hypothetical protein
MTVRDASHRYIGSDIHSFCNDADGFIISNCVWCKGFMRMDDHQLLRYSSETISLPYCSPKCLSEDPEKDAYQRIVQSFISSGGKESYNRQRAIEDQQREEKYALRAEHEIREKVLKEQQWQERQASWAENKELEKALKEKQSQERRASEATQQIREKKKKLVWQIVKAILYIGLAAYIFYAC